MADIIVITTTKQAEAMLQSLERQHKRAKADDYARERERPIKWMQCTCCGEGYQGRQWWNQDSGYGLGDCCVKYCGVNPNGGESECYGVPGIHFLISGEDIKADSTKPVSADFTTCLHDLDENLRYDYEGYVYWKGKSIEHYDSCLITAGSVGGIDATTDLIARCKHLESIGVDITSSNVIWKWEQYKPQPLLVWQELWDAMKANPEAWIETTEEMANEMLCVLPPIGSWGFFLVSEPTRHNENGEAVYAGFKIDGGRHFARYLTIKQFRGL